MILLLCRYTGESAQSGRWQRPRHGQKRRQRSCQFKGLAGLMMHAGIATNRDHGIAVGEIVLSSYAEILPVVHQAH